MAHPNPAQGSPPPVAVLVPIRGFEGAKQRLAPALEPDQRSDLARQMAAGVLTAAHPYPTFVVTGADDVAAWATELGATVIDFTEPGLNPAVAFAADWLHRQRFSRVVVAHGDLPLARTFAQFAEHQAFEADPATVLIGRDRRADGTNVLSVPLGAGFIFHYGPGSAHAHQAEAARLGLPALAVDDPDLAWDVDYPEDLDLLPQQLPRPLPQQFPQQAP